MLLFMARLFFVSFRFAGLISGIAGGIWLAFGRERKHNFPSLRSEIVLYISFFDKAHEGSSYPFACLKGVRLERSTES